MDDKRRETRLALRAVINECGAKLFDAATQAAMHGAWQAWADAQPPGTVLKVNVASLVQVPDVAVAAVARALLALEAADDALSLEGKPVS